MLANLISFVIGFFMGFFILALAKASDDTLDKIFLLKEMWKEYLENKRNINEIDEIINEL